MSSPYETVFGGRWNQRAVLHDIGRTVLGSPEGIDRWQRFDGPTTRQPVDPKTDTRPNPATIFNVSIPRDILEGVWDTRRPIKRADILAAWKRSIWSHMIPVLEDIELMSADKAAMDKALPHVGTNHLRYIRQYWVCRHYAALFGCIVSAVLGIDCVGKTLDENGHHSYDVMMLFDEHGELQVYGVEPQTDTWIDHLDPSDHYTGTGFAIIGG